MSRQSDLKALKQLKLDMTEARAYSEIVDEEWEKVRKINAEIENTKFVFKPLPTNNYATTKAGFVNAWKKFFRNSKKFKAVFLALYSLAMIAFGVILFLAAFKNDGSSLLHAPHKWTDPAPLVLTAAVMAAFPVIAAIYPWAHVVNKDSLGGFLKVWTIALGVSGVVFAVICDETDSLYLLPIILVAVVAMLLLGFVVQLLCFIISLIPIFGIKQSAILAAEKQKDIDNAASNKVNEVKEKEAWEIWWEQRKEELKEEAKDHLSRGDAALEKAKAHLAAANESDILGENEKDCDVIDCLVQLIESRRADSIKEALHEYDAMVQNQKLLEIEAIKAQVEIERAKKENADRQHELEMQRRHQIEMEAQARRNADMQAQIAANTAAAAASAERMRKQAAAAAADAADEMARIQTDVAAIYRNEYYNS